VEVCLFPFVVRVGQEVALLPPQMSVPNPQPVLA